MEINLKSNYKPLGQLCMSDFSHCSYCAAQMKHTVLYGSAHMGDYLIVAIKKSQRVPFPGRHDCRWTAACTNETQRNKWVCAHGRLSPSYLCVKTAPSKAISLCLSNVAVDILKYLKNFCGCAFRSSYRE